MASNIKSLEGLLEKFEISEELSRVEKMRSYLALLEKWNRKMNLTAATTWEALEALFEEAIAAARIYPAGCENHLDIGSGAGFPALLMRILIPEMKLTLIESRAKRAAFLETAVYELGLEGSSVINARLRDYMISVNEGKCWDCYSWKALKLDDEDIALLLEHSREKTEFWMFHGSAPAVRNAETIKRRLRLAATNELVKARGWRVSVFRAQVSR